LLVLRIANPYGPGVETSQGKGALPTMLQQAERGERIPAFRGEERSWCWIGDVARAILQAVGGRAKGGTIYELGGPEVKSFRELMEYVLAVTERRRLLVPLPFWLARLQASLLQFMPTPLLTPDQVELLKRDNVVSPVALAEGRTIEALGIEPAAMEAIVPSYLWRFRKTGQFRGRVA